MPRRRSDKRRILIVGDTLGGLSRSVSDALYRYHRSVLADHCDAETIDFFEEVLPATAVLARIAYGHDEAFLPALTGTLERARQVCVFGNVMQELESSGLERAVALLGRVRPHAVIATSSLAAAVCAEVSPAGVPVFHVLTDMSPRLTWLHPDVRLFFVPTKEVREELVVRGVAWDRIMVTGIPVSERTTKAHAATGCRAELGLSDRFTVTMSAAAGEVDAAAIALGLSAAGIQVVVVSADERAARRLEGVGSPGPLRLVGDTASRALSIKAADVVCARMGSASHAEALALGVPLVIYNPIAGQERFNADQLVNAGVALVARDDEDAIDKVRYLSSHPERLAQMRGNVSEMGRHNACQQVCERVRAMIAEEG